MKAKDTDGKSGNHEVIFETMEQMPAEILVKKEIDESYHQNDFDGSEENGIDHEEVAGFNQEQIEKEPIHIKDEPFQSDYDERNADDVNIEPRLSKQDKIVRIIANKCYICNRVLDSKNEFMEHLKSHKNMLPYECLPCSTKTKPVKAYSVAAINKHLQRHGFYYLCPHCPLRYQTSSGLHLHIRSSHKERKSKYQCETCNKVYTDKNGYRSHINGHRDLAMERYKCEPCGKAFAWKRSLEEHKKTNICARNTEKEAQQKKTANGMKSGNEVIIESGEHKISSTKNDDENLQQKETSASNDSEGSNIANGYHNDDISRNTHEQIELAPIDIKDELKSDDEEMDDNTSTYSNDSESYESNPTVRSTKGKIKSKVAETIPNKCFICDTILENEIEFDDHLESHRNMLPFKCPQCSTEAKPVRAATVAVLNRHFERHGFKFACLQCPLRFRDSIKLANHRRNTHKVETIACETCGKVFFNIREYRNHATAHKNLNMQRYKCEPCQKVFGLKHDFQTHERSFLCIRNTAKEAQLKNTAKEMKSKSEVEFENEEQIEQEPLDIKDEPFESDDDDDMDDEKSSHSENNVSNLSVKQTKQRKSAKVVETIPNKCYICNTILENKIEFDNHLQSHRNMLPYKCSQCTTETSTIKVPNVNLKLSSVTALNEHFESHSFKYVCSHCPSRYRTSCALAVHKRNSHREEKFECEICGEMFGNIFGYRNHISAHQNRTNQRYKCEPCQKVFGLRVGLLSHQSSYLCINNTKMHSQRKTISKETPVQGENHEEIVGSNQLPKVQVPVGINKERFDSNDDGSNAPDLSKSQVQRMQRPRVPKAVCTKCFICDAVLETKSDLHDHLESHKNMLPYKCSQCSTETSPIIFTTVVLLNMHFESHGFEYVCPQCPLRFRTSRVYSSHKWNVHVYNSGQTCEICGKIFVSYNGYRKHLLVHRNLNEERFKCGTCQKILSTKYSFRRHEEWHEKKKQSSFVSKPAKESEPKKEGELKTLGQNGND